MTTNEYRQLSEHDKFDLLARPEDWPEDPAAQAELAGLLELHLALSAHGEEISESLRPRRFRPAPWLLAAAAALLALLPSVYVFRQSSLRAEVRLVDQEARRRAQDRLWSDFFTQASGLIQEFHKNPSICGTKNEDRNAERETASLLLAVSHQLAAQGAPVPEAEKIRTTLHPWLTELSLEDGCLTPARADELRKWASTHHLEDQAGKMGKLLKEEGS
ncbi:MAG: hypothetical protein HY823_08335 [Acidobacteria bacterium]|nr:hypothetical protein [Acidobacteriota bacterium]